MHVVGSKNGNGVKEWLIGLMPPHRVYVEACFGSGAIMRAKRPAAVNIGIDCDVRTIHEALRDPPQPNLIAVHGNLFEVLPVLTVASDWLIYADPPYLLSSRSCKRRYYRHEMTSDAEHERLLALLSVLHCKVMISGYQSRLYSMRLANWRRESFWTVNRRGKRCQEFCWCNFAGATVVHDTRVVGSDCWDRQRIKRKVGRWTRKLAGLPPIERQVILESLQTQFTSGAGANSQRQ